MWKGQFCYHNIIDPWIQKVQQKNMLLMLLSLPVRAMVGGRMASFSPAAYTRAIYHFDRPFTSAKCFTISLLLVTCHEHHVTCRNITALLNSANALMKHREIMWRTCPPSQDKECESELTLKALVFCLTPGKIYKSLPSIKLRHTCHQLITLG